MQKRTRIKAFTLIEVILVIALLALILALAVPISQTVIYQNEGQHQMAQNMLAHARLNEARAFLAADSLEWALESCHLALSFSPALSIAHALEGQIHLANQFNSQP